jgi:hypothetical protein
MTFFTRLRTALSLAGSVEQLTTEVATLRAEVESLRFEWTDILDKLQAREERMRKRYKGLLNATLTSDAPNNPPDVAHADKDQLRSIAAHRRKAGG